MSSCTSVPRSAFRRPSSEEIAFELLVDSCLLTRTTGHGDPNPVHQIWRDA